MEGEDAWAEKRSPTGSELGRGSEKQLKRCLEEEGHQMGQTGEEKARSKDLQEGFQVMVG